MMKDNLEQFIRTNREAFDQASPDLKVWAAIDKALDPPPARRRFLLWRPLAAAASVLLLIGFGTLLGWQLNDHNQSHRSLSDISPELEELEQYYQTELKTKTALLASYDSNPEVKEDLDQLEQFLGELQAELKQAPKGSEEQIVNAMIKNYMDRLAILERVLSRIQSDKDSQKLKNDEEINL